jgi:hypothetical protein
MKSAISILACAMILSACGKGSPTATAGLPAACDAYVATVNACVEKAGGNNPGVAMFKQQMEVAKAEWAKIPDKGTLGPTCKQMEDSFKQTAALSLKC